MKCTECMHVKHYLTGDHEYPQRTHVCYCDKGHWENGNPEQLEDEIECPDFYKGATLE